MDQRSGVGWFSGWSKIFVLCKRNSNAEFWSTRCEDCFSTEQNRLEWFAQVILTSVTSVLHYLRIGLRTRQNGKSDVPMKQRGGWPQTSYNKKRKTNQHSSHLRKLGVCLRHQTFNLRKENLLSTPERQCTWSAKRTWVKSCSPTIVITANGEVQTHEEATVYVKELEIFLTMKVLEDTPAVSSRGKLCGENVYSYEWINGQKTTSH